MLCLSVCVCVYFVCSFSILCSARVFHSIFGVCLLNILLSLIYFPRTHRFRRIEIHGVRQIGSAASIFFLISHVRSRSPPSRRSLHVHFLPPNIRIASLCMADRRVCSAVRFEKGFKPLNVFGRLRCH